MNIKLSQQVSATYARNNFKELTDKVLKEGMCVIVKKSKPITVVLSIEEFKKLKEKTVKNYYKTKVKKKITLEELRKNSYFGKYVGFFKDKYKNISSVELAKRWTDYVD
jgi:prevent-host-death family protein